MDIGESVAKALGESGREMIRQGKFSQNALKYVHKLTQYEEYAGNLKETDFQRIAETYTSVERKMVEVKPIENLKIVETRALAKEIVLEDGTIKKTTMGEIFNLYIKNWLHNHRYTVGGKEGESALYTVLGNGIDAINSAAAELKKSLSEVWIASREVTAKKVPDLTGGT